MSPLPVCSCFPLYTCLGGCLCFSVGFLATIGFFPWLALSKTKLTGLSHRVFSCPVLPTWMDLESNVLTGGRWQSPRPGDRSFFCLYSLFFDFYVPLPYLLLLSFICLIWTAESSPGSHLDGGECKCRALTTTRSQHMVGFIPMHRTMLAGEN